MLFTELIQRLRTGDPLAIREFVEHYEPYIRRSMRRRLAYLNLRAAADSADVCQSALGSFLVRCAQGQFQLDSRRGMEGLLMTIARRKLARLARRELAPFRNQTTRVAWDSVIAPATSSRSDPGNIAADRELQEALYLRLTAEERALLQRRNAGEEWNAIADDLGISSEALRKRMSRSLRRIVAELGIKVLK